VARVVSHVITTAPTPGGVLVFVAGEQDIRHCMVAVRSMVDANKADVLPLHANLATEEQRQVFAQSSKWKVVIATNVAEVRTLILHTCGRGDMMA
jgi:ATP-dependent RNA helicase DHX57